MTTLIIDLFALSAIGWLLIAAKYQPVPGPHSKG